MSLKFLPAILFSKENTIVVNPINFINNLNILRVCPLRRLGCSKMNFKTPYFNVGRKILSKFPIEKRTFRMQKIKPLLFSVRGVERRRHTGYELSFPDGFTISRVKIAFSWGKNAEIKSRFHFRFLDCSEGKGNYTGPDLLLKHVA